MHKFLIYGAQQVASGSNVKDVLVISKLFLSIWLCINLTAKAHHLSCRNYHDKY